MTQRPRKTKQRARKRPSGSHGGWRLWQTAEGRVAAGLIVVVALVAGFIVFSGTPEETPGTAPLASVPIGEAPPPAAPDAVEREDGVASRPPLSRDPHARLPETEAWLKNAVASAVPDDRPMIAIVIDDVGLDRSRSRRAMALPAPVTIALMAYAEDARAQAATARDAGHELIVHLPMEPHNRGVDPGPNALLSDLPADEFERRLEWNLSRFAGYVGVNNHMGSKLTSDPAALAPVMQALKRRGLLFLDSRTSKETQALSLARRFGVPSVERDVFIDHDPSPIGVRTALIRAEDVAQRNGFAIAIGHPKDTTLDALEEWLPEIKARGFAVVPLTAIVRHVASEG